jgi:hypothetical protein
VGATLTLPKSLTQTDLGITLNSGSTVQVIKTACLPETSLFEVDCSTNSYTDPQTNITTRGYCYSRDQSNCPTELYTIEAKIRDSNNNERIVNSLYAVRCNAAP